MEKYLEAGCRMKGKIRGEVKSEKEKKDGRPETEEGCPRTLSDDGALGPEYL
ncbi:MAG TPA: hypothetical protein VK921_17435 [Anditalea sp.]|nr:hypothetical protein [Anditalea sp.]